jgi:hypothetical protein
MATQNARASPGDLARRTRVYVETYRAQFQYLLADETTMQRAWSGAPRGRSAAAERIARGELFLAHLVADRRWVAVHDVMSVDGRPVPDRQDLRALLLTSPVGTVAGRLFAQNARYNLGGIERNFNEPTLVLQLFDPGRFESLRFTHGAIPPEAAGAAVRARAPLVRLTFEERERPTLVSSPRGAPAFARGWLDVDPETGRIHATMFALAHDNVTAALQTTYAPEARLDMWVPVHFSERYRSTRDGADERTDVDSWYTNYRRFEASATVKYE